MCLQITTSSEGVNRSSNTGSISRSSSSSDGNCSSRSSGISGSRYGMVFIRYSNWSWDHFLC